MFPGDPRCAENSAPCGTAAQFPVRLAAPVDVARRRIKVRGADLPDGVRVPASSVLGGTDGRGKGFYQMMDGIEVGRVNEIERLMREAPFMLIGEGTSEIQKMIISRGLLREYRV